MKATASPNTAYALRASPLPFGTFCYRKTSYMLETLTETKKNTKNDRNPQPNLQRLPSIHRNSLPKPHIYCEN